MEKENINLEQEDRSHKKKTMRPMCPMCPMCQMCPCMQPNPKMMGMNQQQMQQPMIGQMSCSNERNEYEDDENFDGDFDEDDSRNGHKHHHNYPYMFNPYFHGGYCKHCGHYHR